ncbi:Mor transcription activator family protein [Candidatus Vondammii sp. HM_W22]|uniref:Mor transcription activator family protein n=1 Tax=Candidatus Vondammii sp. HM_W22 TaxID=2687299 RepID=UPI001F144151|nr:Mor transcription activator family protein [Candidatus Vondammii sp. HM_W22]
MTKELQSRGPELLADLYAHTAELLQSFAGLPEVQANQVATALVDKMRHNWGGQLVYFPKGKEIDIDERDRNIWSDFNGHNQTELAEKYNMTIQGVYQRLRKIRALVSAEQQPDLFRD